MSSTFTPSLRLSASSSFLEMDNKPSEKQGIVTILGSDLVCDRNKASNSLRRTLSADMSSKKWLAQNGFSPMKKIASSEEISVAVASDSSSSTEGEEEEEYCGRNFNIWSEKKNKEEVEKPGQFDIWSSIILQKATEDPSKSLLPPYIHPLVKKSASTLNENSLKICTESLGSETGSDGFSSYPASEASCDIEEADKEEEEEEEEEQQVKEQSQTFFKREDHYGAVKFNHGGGASRKSLPASRSFPPPIPSLSPSVDGASLRMQTRRDNGRLVLEAVSIPSLKNFRAERQEGRLVLTFLDTTGPASSVEEIPMVDDQEKQSNEEEFDEKVVNFDHEEEEEEEREIINIDDDEAEEEDEEVGNENKFNEIEIVMEESSKLSRVLNVHRLAITMNKPNGLPNRNVAAWPSKFNGVISTKLEGDDDEEQLMVPKQVAAQSLPPRIPVSRMIPSSPAAKVTGTATSAAASLNAYEYYWRAKPTATATAVALNPLQNNNYNTLILSKNQMANEQQKLAVFRGNKGDNMVPLLNGCKKPRTSLLFWEPCCIATS